MARGKKGTRNFDAEIALIDGKLKKAKDQTEKYQRQKDMILSEKRESEMKEVYSVMNEKGLSPKDVLDLLGNK